MCRLKAAQTTWGARSDLQAAGSVRARYLAVLRSADANDFQALIEFARS